MKEPTAPSSVTHRRSSPARECDVVKGEHGSELQPVGAVLAEVVYPVVVRAAEALGEERVHAVARDEAEAHGGEEDGDIDAFHLHAHHLGDGVVVALDGEAQVRRGARARERLTLIGGDGLAAFPVLLQVVVAGPGQAVDRHLCAARPSGGADDPVTELGVEVAVEQIGRLHHMHIAINEPQTVFHHSSPRGWPEPPSQSFPGSRGRVFYDNLPPQAGEGLMSLPSRSR